MGPSDLVAPNLCLHRTTYLPASVCLFHIDVVEVVFTRCVTTNEGNKKKDHKETYREVHATSDDFQVEYNYEFLEDDNNYKFLEDEDRFDTPAILRHLVYVGKF